MRGKSHSAEAKAKMSAARKGIGHPCPPDCTCARHDRPSTLPTDPTALREYQNAVHRAWYAKNPRPRDRTRKAHLANRHGMTPDDYAAMFDAQDGRCCYCERPLTESPRQVHIDHDHSCTCGPKKSCTHCRRGLACEACNTVIGKVAEDSERLERMAANLRRLKAEARDRISGKPVQEELPINVAPLRRKESA